MRHRESATADPGPWEPCLRFRLPVTPADVPPELQAALEGFRAAVCRRLENVSFEYRFDEGNALLQRPRDARPDVARIEPGPPLIQHVVLAQLAELGLEAMPSPDVPGQRSNRKSPARRKLAFLRGLFAGLLTRSAERRRSEPTPEGHRPVGPIGEHPPLAHLERWLAVQWDSGVLPAAIARRFGEGQPGDPRTVARLRREE